MEEKIVLPAVEHLQGAPLPVAAQLRLEHGAIVSLLVLIPTPQIVSVIRVVLDQHNTREEASDGLYSAAERVLRSSAVEVMAQLRAAPEVPQRMSDDAKNHRSSQTGTGVGCIRRNSAGLEPRTSFPIVLASRRRQINESEGSDDN